MTPVTSFAGRDGRAVRARRVRARDRAGARGGRRARGRAGTTARPRAARPRGAGIHVERPRHGGLVAASLHSCSSPGVPLTHPEPHWTVGKAQGARRRDHRRHRAVLPRARGDRAGRAVHRHHRHQRQVDDHGADRPSRAGRPGSTCRWAAISAPRSCRSSRRRRSASTWSSARPSRSTSRRRSPRASASCSTSRRIISTGTARCEHYAAHQGAAGGRRRDGRRSASTTTGAARSPTGWTRAGRAVVRISVERPLPRTAFTRTAPIVIGGDGGERAGRSTSPASARCAAQHNAQNARGGRRGGRGASASSADAIRAGLRELPGPRASHGAGRPHGPRAVRQRFQGDQRRRRREGARRLPGAIYWIAGGMPKEGGIAPLAPYFPRIAKAYLIGEATRRVRGDAGRGTCP